LERNIYTTTGKNGVFRCFEVTIGWVGDERVDYITYDTRGIWRCYEIKVSKADFYSNAKKTFVGHFNYFVMPRELFNEVKNDIPDHIGVYADGVYSVKKAKKQDLKVDEQVLKDSMIRSLARDSEKLYKMKNPKIIEQMNTRIRNLQKERDEWRNKYNELMRIGWEKYGSRWYK
jgi:hypothetical protein